MGEGRSDIFWFLLIISLQNDITQGDKNTKKMMSETQQKMPTPMRARKRVCFLRV